MIYFKIIFQDGSGELFETNMPREAAWTVLRAFTNNGIEVKEISKKEYRKLSQDQDKKGA